MQLPPPVASFWSPCWVITALHGGGNESSQVPGSPVEAASQDISEEILFVSYKIRPIKSRSLMWDQKPEIYRAN